eukprot:m.225346 g.225346  ORF g.225346 m.225346 type:complete len:411 (-) comp19204_c0_seq1:464-1696(-)
MALATAAATPVATGSEPDCFEAGDDNFKEGPVAPVQGATKPPEGFEGGSIEDVSLQPKAAFKTFAGKSLYTTGENMAKIGYRQRLEYSIAGSGNDESTSQRFNRIRGEVEAFLGELKAAEESLSADKESDESKETAEMLAQVQSLSDTIHKVQLDALTESWSGVAPAALQSDLSSRLLQDLSTAKEKAAEKAASAASVDGKSDTVTYELYYHPEQNKFRDAAKAGELELRITKLEKLLGNAPLAAAAAELNEPELSITSAVAKMTERVAMVSSENADAMSARLQSLLKMSDEVASKKTAVDASNAEDEAQKVEELYTMAAKWDGVASAVPDIIDRLTALKHIHEQGAEFGATLSHLQATQDQLRQAVSTDKTMLETLETSFKENMAKIEANFTAVNARVEAVSSSLAKGK